jgi:hypothetical protein
LRQENDGADILARHKTIPPEWIKAYEVYGESSTPERRVKLRDEAIVVAWMAVSMPTVTHDWNPDQPREPAGSSEGGQWAGGGGVAKGGEWWEPEWTPAPPKELKISDLKKVGPQMGSNVGGIYADAHGKQFYVKQGKSADHVRNEMLAVKLYRLAGTPTLHYRAVEGGKHIATEITKLDKKNANALSPEERVEAAKDFVVHAWLANWDVVGLGGDNIGTAGGGKVAFAKSAIAVGTKPACAPLPGRIARPMPRFPTCRC